MPPFLVTGFEIMTILGVRRLLYLGIVLAGGVGLSAWGIAYWLPLAGTVRSDSSVISSCSPLYLIHPLRTNSSNTTLWMG